MRSAGTLRRTASMVASGPMTRARVVLPIGLVWALLLVGSPAQAVDAPARLVSYGHSWPAGLGVHLPYPARVAERRDLPMANRAYAGDLSGDTLARVRLQPPRRSDIVTVQTGLNDANAFGLAGLEVYRLNLWAILEETRRARLVVLVLDQHALRPPDHPPYDHGTAEVLQAYRLAAREIAAAVGATVAAPILVDPVEWQDDGMHPNGAGHRAIAAAVAQKIRRSGLH
jgi:lysophospholipase L1-like esterase